MGRIQYLISSIVAINLALMLFGCSSWTSEGECVPTTYLWTFIKNPQAIDSTNIWDILFGSATGLAALAIGVLVVGSFFLRAEAPLYLGMALALVYPVYSWIKLFQNIKGVGMFGDPVSRMIVAIIIVSPIIIAYIFTILDWARGRD